MSVTIDGFGISAQIPPGWDGRIMARPNDPGHDRSTARRAVPDGNGGIDYPVIHLGNFALPAQRGDYGSGAADVMTSRHVLIVLCEFGPESIGTALFAPQGLPRHLSVDRFSPDALQHRIRGQLGYQHFFTDSDRAFCLFVILGGRRHAEALCTQGTKILSSMRIEAP